MLLREGHQPSIKFWSNKFVKHQTYTLTRTRKHTHIHHMALLLLTKLSHHRSVRESVPPTSNTGRLNHFLICSQRSATVSCRGRPQSSQRQPTGAARPDRPTPPTRLVLDIPGGHRQLRHAFLDPQRREAGGRVGVPALSHQLPHHTQSLAESHQGDRESPT